MHTKILIDGIEKYCDGQGYVYGRDITGRECRASFHSTLLNVLHHAENQKVIGGGKVYVLNYNKATFKPSHPMTYEEYSQGKKS